MTLLPCPFCGGPAVAESDEIATTVVCEWCGNQTHGAHMSDADAAAAWNRRRAPGWISVDERLPDFGESVLMWTVDCEDARDDCRRIENDGNGVAFIGHRRDWPSGWEWDSSDDNFFSGMDVVTHWHPLPAPPAKD